MKQTEKSDRRQLSPCEWGRHEWVDRPSTRRPGWVDTRCRTCGKPLGLRPGDKDTLPRAGQRGPGGTWRGNADD